MIRDLQTECPDAAARSEVLIIGAGAAGIVLAVELLRLGRQVSLIEGGGLAIEEASQEPYRSDLAARPHRGIHTGRFRVYGGTTTMWGGQILELDEIDFCERSWVPASGWPIAKRDLAPHYARALELEGVAGSILDDRAVWQRLGRPEPDPDLRPPDVSGKAELISYLSRWCPEPNFARLHRRTLEGSASLHVWLHANAVELLIEGEEVRGVRCRTLTGVEAVFRASEYVFCLGAIESARFFLQPRASGGALPWNQSGLLGRHFQDHIDSDAATLRPVDARALHRQSDTIFLGGYKYNPKLKLTAEAQRKAEVLNAGGTIYSSSDMDATLAETKSVAKSLLRGRAAELSGAHLLRLVRHAPLLARQAYRYAVEHRSWHPADAEMRLRVHCEQQPDSASAITLGEERDALGMLRTRLAWRISSAELRTIRHFVEAARAALAGVAEVVPHPDLFTGEDRFLDRCEDSFHHMGGMRMAASPRAGVVDVDLRLHGTRNAYVCSSAVFPTSGFSNPTHTLLALAVRLAGHLYEQGGRA